MQKHISNTLIQQLKTALPSGVLRFAAFALLALSLYITLLFFNAQLDLEGFNYFSTQLRRMADSLFFALPALFLCKKRYLFTYTAIVVLYIFSNLVYYRNYGTLMPLSSYLMTENLDGLGASIWNSLRTTDLLLVLPTILFLTLYRSFSRQTLIRPTVSAAWKVRLLVLLCIIGIISPSYIFHKPSDYAHPLSLYRFEPARAYRQFGFINYYLYQYYYSQGVSEADQQMAEQFMATYQQKHLDPKPLFQNEGHNLILILVESLQSWPIGLKVSGVEVTPCLNTLVRDTTALYFPNVLPQVKGGRSSDAQLLLNTGLLPIANGAASSLYGTQNYPSLAEALKAQGYFSLSLLCDNKAYWNQAATTKSYHFDALYDKLAKGYPIPQADEHLFEKALPILEDTPQPFYAQLVTMSGHDAVPTDFENPFGDLSQLEPQVAYNLIITHYVDRCIGLFIANLKTKHLYENSRIVITGDHDAITFNRFEGRKQTTLSDRFVPFILLNAPQGKTNEELVIGQSDIYPSLLDLMGVRDYYFRGLGESVFRSPSGFAVYHTGESAGIVPSDSALSASKDIWKVSDALIRMNYFKGKEVK